ncbi:3-phosphoshikimate 1-carboxyvinyltransferase [Desulfovibrio intestinalis]|uniref:5-enolpyruvylshikimate-3-phosphate synthase n=1 Tax=Desulfovibrio intestinalis TaxID=58621 RepID=A0A7W8C0M8_9BACT|nr:3-phosphoshikimate 1-carboxyvinyltransferase [Desulfovibrio intestinalis]MBB5143455.1 5-enolpyruvylshikimate-3-phosphate synthase [Desulfovibrio intestinalis]
MTDHSNDSRGSRPARDARDSRDSRGPRTPRDARDSRDSRGPRPHRDARDARDSRGRDDGTQRRPLRETVCEIDRDILRLLLRRHNILTRMRGDKSRLDSAEEKMLRESWEGAVARISRDARLSGHFFSLMQEVEFLPRPLGERLVEAAEGSENGAGRDGEAPAAQEGPDKRIAFNLAPPAKPVRLRMQAPLACRATRAWLMLAAATGQPTRLNPCLMNDPIVDCVKMLIQVGASLTREDDGVTARPAVALAAPDKVFYVGDSAWNFYLLLGHYLGRPSRAKFMGESSLKLADLSAVRHFLPVMGARLVHVVPKSDGLPARLECSGIIPDSVVMPADTPAELAEGILLAAPGYEHSLMMDLTNHPAQKTILARTLPILRTAGAEVSVEGGVVRIHPTKLEIPAQPELPMEPELALFLLALPLALGGETSLAGQWPQWPNAEAGWKLLHSLGLDLQQYNGKDGNEVKAASAAPLKDFSLAALPADLPADWAPLAVGLAACSALRGGQPTLPELPQGTDPYEVESFLNALGLEQTNESRLCKNEQSGVKAGWNAPSPAWAMAFSLAACAKQHQKLGNPGVMTGLFPAFWVLYNSLPEPQPRRAAAEAAPTAPPRRRIITASVAVPPELKEEDDY